MLTAKDMKQGGHLVWEALMELIADRVYSEDAGGSMRTGASSVDLLNWMRRKSISTTNART